MSNRIKSAPTAARTSGLANRGGHASLTTADYLSVGAPSLAQTGALPARVWHAPAFIAATHSPRSSMKNLLMLCITVTAAAVASTTWAQTTYNGTGTLAALDIDLPGNWTNGLPASALNPGTININSTVDANSGNSTYAGYYITLTGGTMTQFNSGSDPTFSGGSFTVNGGTYGTAAGTGRGFRTDAGNVATLTSGTINSGSTANGGLNLQNGSSLTVNGGLLQQHGLTRSIRLTGNSTLTVNGGTVTMDTSLTANGTFGVNNLSSGNNTINLNGGDTTANFLSFGNNATIPRLRLTLGGTTSGNFTAVDFQALSVSEVPGARRIDWMPDSLMTMTISAAASTWAETEWAAGRMTYNGSGNGTFGNWSAVTTTGFGDGSRFNMSGNTLSIVAVPEPSSLALVGLAGAGFVALRRMRKRGRKS